MKKNLLVLAMAFLMLGLFSYAALSQETKPFDKGVYADLIRVYMTKDGEKLSAIESWTEGCLIMFQLNFQRLDIIKVQVLDIEPMTDGYFAVTAHTELTGLCLDQNGEKFRVIVGRDLVFLFKGNDVAQIMIIQSTDPKMIQGWAGTSI